MKKRRKTTKKKPSKAILKTVSRGTCTKGQRRHYHHEFRERGWSQNAAAKHAGVAPSYLGRWLRGEMISLPLRVKLDATLARTAPPTTTEEAAS